MANLFDSTYYPTAIPNILYAGDRWAWKRTDLASDYGSGYTLEYELTFATGSNSPITLTATLSGSDYLIEIPAATTVTYKAGDYRYTAVMTRDSDSERVAIGYGTLEIKPNPATSTADGRSHARKTLDAIEAVIENRATLDQESYSIAGRSLSRTSITDLLLLRDRYKAEVKREEQAEAIRQGMRSGNQIIVRMR